MRTIPTPPLLLLLASSSLAIDNGLGKVPGLGWNSDYAQIPSTTARLGGYQNDLYIRGIASFMNTSGLQAMGYKYVNMDAGWNTLSRGPDGNLVPDPTEWPNGINATIDFVHSLGLGFGLYGDRGTLDCSKRPGNAGHEQQDADFYASLNIDWFKTDSCYASADPDTAFAEYATMRDALANATAKTGRPIWLALCGWNTWYAPVGKSLGNSWRIGIDTGGGWLNVMSNVNAALGLAKYAGPTANGGGWNDLSLLLTPGMGGTPGGPQYITNERHRSQFTMHVIFAANMLMTGNLSSLDPYILETWGNAEAVAINQDPAGNPFVVLTPAQDEEEEEEEVAAAAYTYASVAECGGEPNAQNWTFNVPLAKFLQNPSSSLCLNVDACGTQIIYDTCTTTGTTCAGKGVFSNEEWDLRADGALVSLLPGGLCVTVAGNSTIVLTPCASPALTPNQTWTYAASSNSLQNQGLCITAPSAPPPPGTSKILVGRSLADGSWGLAALNDTPQNATITCGAECFAALGCSPTSSVRIRDVWAHADVGTQSCGAPFEMQVGGNGTSVLYRLYPA
jgi:alpha-galactosidase